MLLVVTWLAIAGVGGPTFGRLSEVSSNDQASFLPAGAEATAAQDWQAKFRDSNEIPAVIVIESDSAFTPAQLGEAAALKGKLEALRCRQHRDRPHPVRGCQGRAVCGPDRFGSAK